MGLTSAQAGTILFFGAIGDAAIDPVAGWLAARTTTRWGRYRPYLLFGAIPLSLAYVACFWVPPFEGEALFWYALLTLGVFRAAFQLIYMPYTSMIVVLSRDPDERADIEGWRAWFVAAGSLAISFGAISSIGWLGMGSDRLGFIRLACIVGVAAAAAFLFTGTVTREVKAAHEQPDESNMLTVARLLVRNDQFWVVAGAMIVSQSAYAVILSGAVPYFEAALGERSLARWPLSALTAAGLVASFFWPAVCRRLGKRVTWAAGLMLCSLSLILTYFFVPDTIIGLSVGFFLLGCGVQSGLIIQFAAAADALDYGQWKTGQRTEAIGFAVITFVMKISLAVGNGLTGWCYDLAGFRPDVAADAQVQADMRAVFLCLPAGMYLVSAAIVHFYQISASRHRDMIAQIDKRQKDAAVFEAA
jgi:GPH family glycoside/pentoside/hexuronide:cation symporter